MRPLDQFAGFPRADILDYSLTGELSVTSGAASGASVSPEPDTPNPYGERSLRRRPRAGNAPPSDGGSKPEGPASGEGEAAASGGGAPGPESVLFDLGLAVMKDGSPGGAEGAAASTPASLTG